MTWFDEPGFCGPNLERDRIKVLNHIVILIIVILKQTSTLKI